MNTSLKTQITVIATFLILLVSCNLIGESGSGNVVREERKLTEFNSLEISGAFHIYLTQGLTQSVIVEADDNLMKLIRTEVTGNTLKIYTKDPIRSAKTMDVYITMPDLKEISVSGAVNIETKGRFKSSSIDIDISGSTDSNLELEVQKLNLESSGGCKLRLSGTAGELSCNVSGAVDLFAYDLVAGKVSLDISGAGKAELNVTEELSADVSGAANVRYKGNPKRINQDISGAGSIKKAE